VADDGVTLFQRQSAGDLFGRHSHRKAVSHQFAQVRLARQLVSLVASSSPLGEVIGASRVVAAWPGAYPSTVALQFPFDRRGRSAERRRNRSLRFTACMQAVNLNPLFKAELAVLFSHRDDTCTGVALVA
jgi:hypothetical protein